MSEKHVWWVHNRPHENDCFDAFLLWCQATGKPIEGIRWDEFSYAECLPGYKIVCMMQDPVGSRKASAMGPNCINHPTTTRRACRDLAYPLWLDRGVPCPPPVWEPDYDLLRSLIAQGTALIVKETAKQMGRAYFVDSVDRLDWLWAEAKRFDPDKYKAIEYVDVRWPDGLNRMHRWLVTGPVAIPVAIAHTKSWCCKDSHMSRQEWDDESLDKYLDEYEDFIRLSDAHEMHTAVKACEVLGVEMALVDISPRPSTGGEHIVWEINPYMNLNPKGVPGKEKLWWPFVASYLCEETFDCELPTREEIREKALTREPYKQDWRQSR